MLTKIQPYVLLSFYFSVRKFLMCTVKWHSSTFPETTTVAPLLYLMLFFLSPCLKSLSTAPTRDLFLLIVYPLSYSSLNTHVLKGDPQTS